MAIVSYSVIKTIIVYFLTVLATFTKNWNVSSSSIISKSKEAINNHQKLCIKTQSRYLPGLFDMANCVNRIQFFKEITSIWGQILCLSSFSNLHNTHTMFTTRLEFATQYYNDLVMCSLLVDYILSLKIKSYLVNTIWKCLADIN